MVRRPFVRSLMLDRPKFGSLREECCSRNVILAVATARRVIALFDPLLGAQLPRLFARLKVSGCRRPFSAAYRGQIGQERCIMTQHLRPPACYGLAFTLVPVGHSISNRCTETVERGYGRPGFCCHTRCNKAGSLCAVWSIATASLQRLSAHASNAAHWSLVPSRLKVRGGLLLTSKTRHACLT
jgi:hypothetical protein